MRVFSNPTYEGPDCVCCKTKQQIIELLKSERDTWIRQTSFNYRVALTNLVQKIEDEISH